MSAISKHASTLLELKKIQQELGVSGETKEAMVLGNKVRQHELRLACQTLGVSELPGTLNGVLIKEIAVQAALLDNPVERYRLKFLLKRMIGREQDETTSRLMKAKAAFPNLRQVEDALK